MLEKELCCFCKTFTCFLAIAESREPADVFVCFPGSPPKGDLVILANVCCSCEYACREGRHEEQLKASPFQQTLENFYKALLAISLEYFGVCPADLQSRSSPSQNTNRSRPTRSRQLWQVSRGRKPNLEVEVYLIEGMQET